MPSSSFCANARMMGEQSRTRCEMGPGVTVGAQQFQIRQGVVFPVAVHVVDLKYFCVLVIAAVLTTVLGAGSKLVSPTNAESCPSAPIVALSAHGLPSLIYPQLLQPATDSHFTHIEFVRELSGIRALIPSFEGSFRVELSGSFLAAFSRAVFSAATRAAALWDVKRTSAGEALPADSCRKTALFSGTLTRAGFLVQIVRLKGLVAYGAGEGSFLAAHRCRPSRVTSVDDSDERVV